MTMEIPAVRNDETIRLHDVNAVAAWARAYIAARPTPDFFIGLPDGSHQLDRWWIVPRNPVRNVYLHRFNFSDEDRALHDHPGDNVSWVVDNCYLEHLADGSALTRFAGDVVSRAATDAHRVELVNGPCLSLFFMGPLIRNWGFHCPQGWRPWQEFVEIEQGGNHRGKGCE